VLRLKEFERRFITQPAEPSERQIKRAYRKLGSQRHVALIDTRQRSEAEEIAARLRAGEEFETLARRLSIHPSRSRGGDLGWLSWGSLDPESEKVAEGTEPGEVTVPFAFPGGYRILTVLEEREGEPPPLEKVRDSLRSILRRRRSDGLRAEIVASIRKAHPAWTDERALESLLAGDPGGESPPGDTVLMRTAGGLELTAGKVRQRARRRNQDLPDAWSGAAQDALLIDEARRRIALNEEIERRVRSFIDEQVLGEVERTVILERLEMEEAEVKAFFEENRDRFTAPGAYHLRHIVLATREEAEEVRELLLQGGDFERLAAERSLDTRSAPSGGDLGWIQDRQDADGVLARVVRDLPVGATSEALEVPGGFAILQVLEVRPSRSLEFGEAKHAAARGLATRKRDALRRKVLDQLREHSDIQIFDEGIERANEVLEGRARERLERGSHAQTQEAQ